MTSHFFYQQSAIVTGASSGIGQVLALELARQGAFVTLASRNTEMLAKLESQIRSLGGETLVVPYDATLPDDAARLKQAVMDRFGRIDLLILNAGQYIQSPVDECDLCDLEQSMQVNFWGSVRLIQVVLPDMLARGKGHIALNLTADVLIQLPQDAPYAAAKSAMSAYASVLRREVQPRGVNVTLVYPGRVDTPMISHLRLHPLSGKISPAAVVRATLTGIRRHQPVVIIPFQARLLYYTNVFSPRLADWIIQILHLQGWEK